MSGRGKRRFAKNKSSAKPPIKVTATAPEAVNVGSSAGDSQEQEEKFQRELAWCIQHIEHGLTSHKDSSTQGQVQDAVKILKVLRNPKAPLVKKRQVMRNTFGDYRQKMEAEEKKYSQNAKKISFKTIPSANDKFTYFKKSTQNHSATENATTSESVGEPSQPTSGFKFNFITDEPSSDAGNEDCDNKESMDSPPVNPEPTDNSRSQTTAVNYYKMSTTSNSFTFNFNVPDPT